MDTKNERKPGLNLQATKGTMKLLVIHSSPNKEGLTAACAAAAWKGARQAGATVEMIQLNDLNIGNCQACDDGWGTCLAEHRCKVEDGFQAMHKRLAGLDGLILVTPVYWGEMSESAKAFTDRLRRCEATRKHGQSLLFNKPVIAVAAAGGSGGGMISCLASMERWIQHVQARTFDLNPVNRWSREYKLLAIRSAGKTMALELQQKE
jgi:multimeric flavodoxin WrbA